MSWIILALTLGASITSIIHGVFMLFGSLTISGGALFGIPSTMLASLPIISAVFALIGGIIAFNKSKWGALFLFIAGGLCVPSRDTWLYGGIYFLAALLCFLLKADPHNEYQDILYDDEDLNNYNSPEDSMLNEENLKINYNYDNSDMNESSNDDFYYQQEQPQNFRNVQQIQQVNQTSETNNEPPKLRRRTSKICPDCGATVSREDRFCPNCGAKLFVIADKLEDIVKEEEQMPSVNEQLLVPSQNNDAQKNFKVEIENVKVREINNDPIDIQQNMQRDDYLNPALNFDIDGDDMSAQSAQNYRMVKPVKNTRGYSQSSRSRMNNDDMFDEAASSYQQFSKYTRRAKKRKRSAGRKILSMLLLVSAVGGALYFLLGLRKLPPGELPPIARNDVRIIEENDNNSSNVATRYVEQTEPVAQPQNNVDLVVAENILPNFTPDRTPKSGMIIGSNVNVRADHTTTSNRITRLNVNSKIDIIGTFNVTSGQYQGIWYNITTGGREGWVYGRYIQPLGSGLPSGYSNALMKSFGNTRSQLVEALGTPSKSSSTSAEWPGLTANLRGEDITRIRITSSNRELQNGLKVGMSQTALYQVMGFPSGVSNRIMQYNEGSKTGLSVQLDKNNSISVITVSEVR